jgi:hypothetical protein
VVERRGAQLGAVGEGCAGGADLVARAHSMRARVLSGKRSAWEAGPRAAAELEEAAAHYERAAELSSPRVLRR